MTWTLQKPLENANSKLTNILQVVVQAAVQAASNNAIYKAIMKGTSL